MRRSVSETGSRGFQQVVAVKEQVFLGDGMASCNIVPRRARVVELESHGL